jgi:hypothetical protein
MPHADMIQLSRLCGANFRSASDNGLLTDAFIAANNTNQATLRAAVGNETNLHAEIIAQRGRLQRALDYDGSTYGIGDITDSNLPSTTTVAGLIALTQEPSTSTARELVLE